MITYNRWPIFKTWRAEAEAAEKQLAEAQRQIAELERLVPEAMEVVLRVEWVRVSDAYGGSSMICPLCNWVEGDDHMEGCLMGNVSAAIRKYRKGK